MTNYALDVRYGDESAARIPLPAHTDAERAEVERQALVHRVENAVEIVAPEIYARDTAPGDDTAIDPGRVTSIDLINLDEEP